MDPQYKPLYQAAQDLQYKVHDAIDDHNHPMANVMKQEMRTLMDDMEANKSPKTIENRMQTIQHQLLEIRSQQDKPVMSYDHSNHFHREFENMRQDLRKFHNY